ncbi:23S rRNA (uracil(1939)-C(5))-methyltransferase RlmD [Oscillatoria sp. CS-180]|uniref:23S rRNA (uracil(1939)-C(5))-methyltransferase RlmD n=1 Tax=Oscillatoria sp. CS-180 TaxID=3021720 RepID=UPI0023303995|nr:23S rRNA (uracil(1939)-C(5))-methyltransferase RlmD [Oscillatoria sp. CS-180]MDB9524421.1 23S rRNA (uracil(1939)-C(5))-methyltransferase RlmD [Oscillatoria sp. CS-180]
MIHWQQGQTLELDITDLSSSGEGVGRWDNRVVFVPDTVPGDRIQTRLIFTKPSFGRGKLLEILQASSDRIRPACIVADKCGGCQWQSVTYEAQLAAKQQQVTDALTRIGGFADVQVDPILAADHPLDYRNKATYPLGRSPEGKVKAGYFRKGTHQIVNLNQCPVQDDRLDPLLAEVKQDIQQRGWSIFDESSREGALRHLALRIGRRTGQMLLTLISTTWELEGLEEQCLQWKQRYPELAGICINRNRKSGNAIWGKKTRYVVGQPYLEEQFAELTFHIYPTTFFQIHTEQAERLLAVIVNELQLQGTEAIVDAYCGIGTLTLPIAQRAEFCLGLEVQDEAVEIAAENAELNGIANVRFQAGTVAELLPQVRLHLQDRVPDVVMLDPPRKGCDDHVLEALISLHPQRIAYMSCNPATLARDLKKLCRAGGYHLNRVQPADFFPQTAHVECVAFLVA